MIARLMTDQYRIKLDIENLAIIAINKIVECFENQ